MFKFFRDIASQIVVSLPLIKKALGTACAALGAILTAIEVVTS